MNYTGRIIKMETVRKVFSLVLIVLAVLVFNPAINATSQTSGYGGEDMTAYCATFPDQCQGVYAGPCQGGGYMDPYTGSCTNDAGWPIAASYIIVGGSEGLSYWGWIAWALTTGYLIYYYVDSAITSCREANPSHQEVCNPRWGQP